MRPGEIYLDALFPLVVRHRPQLVLLPQNSCTFVLCVPEATAIVDGNGQYRVENGFCWFQAGRIIRIRSEGETWGVVVGRRLLDQLVVASFGEPGFSRFLDDLTGSGTSACGPGALSGIGEAFSRLALELTDRKPAYRTKARSLLIEVCTAMYRAGLTSSSEEADSHRLTSIIDYLDENYDRDLAVPELARMAGYSTSHFSRVFSRAVGTPVSEYINRLRIRKACLLMKRSDRTITEISFEVGYNNVSFFNRYFKRVMNMTPREYRNYLNQ